MAIVITGLPLTESINKQLMSVRGRLIKTKSARDFDRLGVEWIMKNHRQAKQFEIEAKKILGLGMFLRVDCYFVFNTEKLYWKRKGTLRRRDANNLVKSSLDLVSKIIDVDDTYFVSGNVEKIECKSSSDEQLIVVITPAKLRTLNDLNEILARYTIAPIAMPVIG